MDMFDSRLHRVSVLKPCGTQIEYTFLLLLTEDIFRLQDTDEALQVIHDVATENMGALCVTEPYRSLKVPLVTSQYEGAQQKADMAAMLLQDLGVSRHNGTKHSDMRITRTRAC
jgi:hypothetical protein